MNRGFDSNEIAESDWQNEKCDDPRTSTFCGISVNPGLGSNEIDASSAQLEKHDSPSIVTFPGISIDLW
jgi:hypothetical protein